MDLLDNIAFVAETVWEEENGIYEEIDSEDIENIEYNENELDDELYNDEYNNFEDDIEDDLDDD